MELSENDVARLLRRCALRRRQLQAIRLLRSAFELAWPGALAVLVGAIAARALHLPLAWVPFALGLWLVTCALRVLRLRHTLALPPWFWVAYVDRHARAGGALLRRFEAPAADADPVPQRARDVPLKLALPWRELQGTAGVAAAYALCLSWPLPAAAPARSAQLVPLPVARTEELLKRVEPHDPETKAFVAAARRSLAAFESKAGGLRRADFGAIERITRHARELLENDARARAEAREALAAFDTLLTTTTAANGGEGKERAAGAMRDAERRVQEALTRAGLDPGRFAELLQEARRNAERHGDRASDPSHRDKPFADGDVTALRQEIRKLREATGAAQGSGGIGSGPATAPLELAHEATWLEGARLDPQTFPVNQDRDTVLLSTAASKRDETAYADPGAESTRSFAPGNDTEYWDKQLSPHRRAVLQRYFDQRRPHD